MCNVFDPLLRMGCSASMQQRAVLELSVVLAYRNSPATVVEATSPYMPAYLNVCHPEHLFCFIVAEVFLLGPLYHWPQLEVRDGLPGTADRTNSGVPGVRCAIHVPKYQPHLLGCQVRHAWYWLNGNCRLAVQQCSTSWEPAAASADERPTCHVGGFCSSVTARSNNLQH